MEYLIILAALFFLAVTLGAGCLGSLFWSVKNLKEELANLKKQRPDIEEIGKKAIEESVKQEKLIAENKLTKVRDFMGWIKIETERMKQELESQKSKTPDLRWRDIL